MPKLTLVPTPIGHLQDITLRGIEILKNSTYLFCEDTRKTAKLLHLLEIPTPKLFPFHLHNEHQKTEKYLALIQSVENTALVSDAGTPGISDPGFLLVRACLEAKVAVEVLPGPTAFVPALVLSGMPCNRFFFEGFLPPKKGRETRLVFLASLLETIVLYESPHKLLKTLGQIKTFFKPEIKLSVSRELTKFYEETVRGSIEEIVAFFEAKDQIKGEFVVVIDNRA